MLEQIEASHLGLGPTLAAVLASGALAGIPAVVYETGDLAQGLGLAWTPFVLLGARRCYSRPGLAAALLFGLAEATQTLIHNISTVMALGLAVTYVAVRGLRPPGAKWAAVGAAMGLGLAAFFWLPAFAEKDYVFIERVYQQQMAPWSQLIRLPGWWTALSHFDLAGAANQVPFAGRSLYVLRAMLPPLAWGLAFVLLVGGYRVANGNRRLLRDELFLWVALFAISYFSMAESAWAWRTGSPLRLVQVPVRVAHLAVIIGPPLAALGARELWWRLRWGKPFELGLALVWFALFLGGATLFQWSKAPGLPGKILIGAGAPLAVALFAYALKRAPGRRITAAALVALAAGFAIVAARDRLEKLGGVYHPIRAPDSALTAQAYLLSLA